MVYEMTRGLRNNNPGNIRKSKDAWQGLEPDQTDPDFFQFTTPEYGIRAIAKILTNGYAAGRRTIRQVITRWAPPSENDTEAYIAAVSRSMRLDPEEQLSFPVDLVPLVAAIIRHENGVQPYGPDRLNAGVQLV